MPARFEPPRRQFPTDGPFKREELMNLDNEELNAIPVTKENVHQLAYYCDPIGPSRLRSHFASFQLDVNDIVEDQIRRERFRNWATQDLDKIRLLAEHYKLALATGEAYAYIPQVYWVDEELGKAVRSGPFFVQCRESSFKCYDMRTMVDTLSPMGQPHCDRWRRMEHPHMHDESVCLGTETSSYFNNAESGDLYALMEIFEGLIQIYNPDDPHRHFNDQFRGEIIVEEVEKAPMLVPDSNGIYLAYNDKVWEDCDLAEFKVGGMTLMLSPKEMNFIDRARPDYVRSYLTGLFRDNLPNYVNGVLAERQRLFFDRALPAGNGIEERIANAGITMIPGFNIDDDDMEATYTPYTKEHGIDFTDYDKRQAEQAENAEQAEGEEAPDSSETEAAAVDTEQESGQPQSVGSDTF